MATVIGSGILPGQGQSHSPLLLPPHSDLLPTISYLPYLPRHRIRQLLDVLRTHFGVRLFDRLGRNVRLTGEGEVLLELASTILANTWKISERVGALGIVQGVVRFGLPETFALACLPELMRSLGRDYPGLRVELAIGTSSTLLRDLEDRRLEVAILSNPRENPRLRMIPLGQHEMVWAASPDLETRPPIRPGDIRAAPIISNPYPSPQYLMIMEWFRSAGLAPLRLSFCTSVTVIAELVAAGVAISILPRPLIQAQVEAGRLRVVPARPAPPCSRLYAAYRAADGNANVDAVIRAIREVLERVRLLEAA
jgi:DNA-binding transcriptional LysR family regulator